MVRIEDNGPGPRGGTLSRMYPKVVSVKCRKPAEWRAVSSSMSRPASLVVQPHSPSTRKMTASPHGLRRNTSTGRFERTASADMSADFKLEEVDVKVVGPDNEIIDGIDLAGKVTAYECSRNSNGKLDVLSEKEFAMLDRRKALMVLMAKHIMQSCPWKHQHSYRAKSQL